MKELYSGKRRKKKDFYEKKVNEDITMFPGEKLQTNP
jgi:hypothetical protein